VESSQCQCWQARGGSATWHADVSSCSRSRLCRCAPHRLRGWGRPFELSIIQQIMRSLVLWWAAVFVVTAAARGAAQTTRVRPTTTLVSTTTTARPDTTTTATASPTTTTTATFIPATTTFIVTTTTIPLIVTTTTTTTVGVTTTTTPTTVPVPCVPDNPAACDDGDPCTADSCDGAFLTCVHAPLDGTPCPDDGVFCTEDRCVAGVCEHRPLDLRCDRGACVMRACDPGKTQADRDGCVLVRGKLKADGTPCTDDGFSCTDDACTKGVCLHLPVDDRCVPPGECVAAACAPARLAHDRAGCSTGPPRAEGQECAEDADVCSRDVCRGGSCRHEPQPDRASCAPVQDAFRRTRALGTLAGELGMDVPPAASVPPSASPVVNGVLDRLAVIEAELAAAADALAGNGGLAPMLSGQPADTSGIPAAQRARIAFTIVLRTPGEVASFLQTLQEAQARQALGLATVRHLRRQGRALHRSTRGLKSELRRLARGSP